MRERPPAGDRGFTLVETLTAIIIFGILSAAAVWAWSGYTRAQAQQGSASDIVQTLRNAQERAQSDAMPYCVRFTVGGQSWSLYRGSCGTGTLIQTWNTESNRVTVSAASFTAPDTGVTSSDVQFLPRGVASAGSLTVSRTGASKTVKIDVVGLTSRVCQEGVDTQCG